MEEKKKLKSKPKLVKIEPKKENHFADLFLAEDLDAAKDDVLRQIVIPRVKRTFIDALKRFLDIEVTGGSSKSSSGTTYTNYRKASEDDGYTTLRPRRKAYEVAEVEFDNKEDAETVLSELELTVEKSGCASVADYYDLVDQSNMTTSSDTEYGWTRNGIRQARIIRRGGKFTIQFPNTISLR